MSFQDTMVAAQRARPENLASLADSLGLSNAQLPALTWAMWQTVMAIPRHFELSPHATVTWDAAINLMDVYTGRMRELGFPVDRALNGNEGTP